MRQIIFATFAVIILMLFLPGAVSACGDTNKESVRNMLIVPDNADFTVFDPALLPDILIDIIENDPPDAPYHERVVDSALKALGQTHNEKAIDILVAKIEDYPLTCIFWLGTFATSDAVNAIVEYLNNDDASIRIESADALSKLPQFEGTDKDEAKAYVDSILIALTGIAKRINVEDDERIKDSLYEAWAHLAGLTLMSANDVE